MANITGIVPGLTAGSLYRKREEQRVQREIETRNAEKIAARDEVSNVCKTCGGVIQLVKVGRTWSRDGDDTDCFHCLRFFGNGVRGTWLSGTTDWNSFDSKRRIDEARELGYVMALKTLRLGTDDGLMINIEPADIFKVSRAGASSFSDPKCCYARTKQTFSIEIMVGPAAVTLWPHEFGPIAFARIMELKRLGQIEESYVASEDESGHFAPTQAMRTAIVEQYGKL